MIDAKTAQLSTFIGNHHSRSCLWITRQQDWVASLGEWRPFQGMMSTWERTSRSFAMHPRRAIINNFLSGNVVANEIHQLTGRTRNHFLKRFEY